MHQRSRNWPGPYTLGTGIIVVLLILLTGLISACSTEQAAQETAPEPEMPGAQDTTQDPAAPDPASERNLEQDRYQDERSRQVPKQDQARPAQSTEQPEQPAAPPDETSGTENTQQDDGTATNDTVTVTNIVDGDTFDISPALDGVDRVRIIGVDTPETSFGAEPLGYEATAFAESLLLAREVTLEFDVERIDPYDRLLAYVYLTNGTMFNEEITREGYAQVATFPPNVKYQEQFLAAQQEARDAGRGLWGLTADEQCEFADRGNNIGGGCEEEEESATEGPAESLGESGNGSEPETTGRANYSGSGGGGSAPAGGSCPADAPIKGNDSSSGELIYHSPGGSYYDRTDPEECFASESEAQEAGYRASQR